MNDDLTVIEQSGIALGQVVVQRMLDEVQRIARDDETDVRTWFGQVVDVLDFSEAVQTGFEHVRALLLAVVKRRWEDLPFEIRKEYALRFDLFALRVAPDLAWKTIENRIRVAETFFLDRTNLPERVAVPERLPDGKPRLGIDGKPVMQMIDFDPMTIDISKLTLARSVVESGQARENPTIFSMLADKYSTFSDLRSEMFSPASKKAGIAPEMRFALMGPILIVERNGQTYELGELNFDAYYHDVHPQHELARDSLDKLMRCLGVVLDEDVTDFVQHKKNLEPLISPRDESRRIG